MAVDRSWGWQEGFKRKSPSAVQSLPDESEKQKAFFFFLNGSHYNPYIEKERGCVCLKEASPGRNFSRTKDRVGIVPCTAPGDSSTWNAMQVLLWALSRGCQGSEVYLGESREKQSHWGRR